MSAPHAFIAGLIVAFGLSVVAACIASRKLSKHEACGERGEIESEK